MGAGGEELDKAFRRLGGGGHEVSSTVKAEERAGDFGGGGGHTTLMLFNIFTPDEVDFLAQLVRCRICNVRKKDSNK